MYNEYDYLTMDILNSFETEISELYGNNQEILLSSYSPKTWNINEFIYVDDIKNIEDAIENAGKRFDYPIGWINSKEWNLEGFNNISCKDLNRWRKNLDLIYDKAKKIELKYSNEIYCGEEVSL